MNDTRVKAHGGPVSDRFRHNFSKSYLAETFGISRPTLYKYMELYDQGIVDDIPGRVLDFFDFVSEEDRSYDDMTGFLNNVMVVNKMEAPAREPDGLRWATHDIRTVPVVSDGTLTVVFKDAFPNPSHTFLRVTIEVSGERHVIAECSPEPGMHYIRVDGLPRGVRMEYALVQTGLGIRMESEPHGFRID